MSKEYKIIIDTEQYSGNFEREMCAYITGRYGECGVGYEIAKFYASQINHLEWFKENIVNQPDEDNGCNRPVSVSVTPGWFNNGYGRHIREGTPTIRTKHPAYLSVEIYTHTIPPKEVIEEIIERAKYFCLNRESIYAETSKYITKENKEPLTFTGVRIVQNTTIENEICSYKP